MEWVDEGYVGLDRSDARPSRSLLRSESDAVGPVRCFVSDQGLSIRLVIDRLFDFEHATDALKYLNKGSHVGKIVIRV
jgi:hypothetical protein